MSAKTVKEALREIKFKTKAEEVAFGFGWNAAIMSKESVKTSHNMPITFASQIADDIERAIGPEPRSERGSKDWRKVRGLCQQLRNGQ